MKDTLKKRLPVTLLLLLSLWYAGAAMANATLERSGSWYDPAHDGEGFIVQFFSDSQAVIYWFTYNEDGTQRWFIGLGDASGDRLVIDNLQITDGGVFGPAFNPDDVVRTDVGELVITFDSDICGGRGLHHQ